VVGSYKSIYFPLHASFCLEQITHALCLTKPIDGQDLMTSDEPFLSLLHPQPPVQSSEALAEGLLSHDHPEFVCPLTRLGAPQGGR
jgi:hypothetical protein